MIPMQPQAAGLPSGTIGGRRRRSATGWHVSRLWAAPARLAFAAGMLALVLSVIGWGVMLWASTRGQPWTGVVPAGVALALWLGWGVWPFFVAGLVFKLLPRCLHVPAITARALSLPLAALWAGLVLASVGCLVSTPLAATGLALAAVGQALLAGRVVVLMLDSRVADHDHARLIAVALATASLALWAASVAVALNQPRVVLAASQAALWGGWGLALVVVAHRLLPQAVPAMMSSQAAWHSRAVLAALSLLMAVQAPFAAAEVLQGGTLAGLPAALRAGVEWGGGLALMWLSLRWGLRYSLRAQAMAVDSDGRTVLLRRGALGLLTVLHAGFAWLAVAFTLGGFSRALMALTDGQQSLGDAPLRAFVLGGLGSLVLATVTQVMQWQTGRPLGADPWTRMLGGVLQAGVALAVLAALFSVAAVPLTWLASQFLGLAALTWVLRCGRWLGRARVDGAVG
jgi:uncharacterized protein involved in response to NO